MKTPSRRQMLGSAAALGAWLLVRPAAATPDELVAAIQAYTRGAPVQDGQINFDISPIVDNGNTVPVTIKVDSPMRTDAHVRSIALFSERNPQREIAVFHLGPRAGRAQISTRIRLATSQKLVALAHMSDDSYRAHTVDVIVSIAACIEGDV